MNACNTGSFLPKSCRRTKRYPRACNMSGVFMSRAWPPSAPLPEARAPPHPPSSLLQAEHHHSAARPVLSNVRSALGRAKKGAATGPPPSQHAPHQCDGRCYNSAAQPPPPPVAFAEDAPLLERLLPLKADAGLLPSCLTSRPRATPPGPCPVPAPAKACARPQQHGRSPPPPPAPH